MTQGVAEEAAELRRDDASAGLARYMRFGEYRPPYEVLSVNGDRIRVELFQSGEKAEVSLAEALDNPLAT